MKLAAVHPFPARMAPEVVDEAVAALPSGATVLDPMCGSGTVIRLAAERGLPSIGTDLDPLAVVISECWASPPATHELLHDAEMVVRRARAVRDEGIDSPPWHDDRTREFAQYWFAEPQRLDLTAFAIALRQSPKSTHPALQTALSRTIIKKEHGASLARDVSRSRPHRVTTTNDYSVFDGFNRSVRFIAQRLSARVLRHPAQVFNSDARCLANVPDESIDCVITSPPYLNAIDYMRGHRLSLIWFGFSMDETSTVRSRTVGAERAGNGHLDIARYVNEQEGNKLDNRQRGWVQRYLLDANEIVASLSRVTRSSNAKVVMVIGNSTIRGVRVDNAGIYAEALRGSGFQVNTRGRLIPTANRSLPLGPPGSPLAARMREEVILEATR